MREFMKIWNGLKAREKFPVYVSLIALIVSLTVLVKTF